MTKAPVQHCCFDGFSSSGRPADSVSDMINSASLPNLESEFDAFLFAPVGDDKNGMLLSVLSALARLDVDPWQEAANLARLPGNIAIERLTSLISALPGRPASPPEPETIAARLIALLPSSRGDSIVQSRGEISGGVPATNLRAVVRVAAFNLILLVFMLGAQWMAISHVSPTQAAETAAATSRINSVETLTPNPGQ